MHKIKQFEDELIDHIFAKVKYKTEDNLWWDVFGVIELPIQDMVLMNIKNQMEEKYFS